MEPVTHFAEPNAGAGPLGPFHPLCGEPHQINEGLSPKAENVTCAGCLKKLAEAQGDAAPAAP